jgi:hypothetical protein
MALDTLLKYYIRSVDINEGLRSELVFSDADKIRMYSDNVRLGVRLKPFRYNKPAKKVEFLTFDSLNEVTVRLPKWEPNAVKGWEGFEEYSRKPEGTAINWRISDGTDDYWYNGGAWAIASSSNDWNTEIEISANINTFPHIQKCIQFVARLETTDRWVTPVLLGTRLLLTASFDWFEDLILRSLVPRMREDFTFLMDWSGVLNEETDRFNIETDNNFRPEESLNVIGIEAVYNQTTDPDYEIDILQSFNPSTGEVILTGTLPIDTRLFYRLNVEPEVAVNFTNTDYDEIGKTPSIIIDRIDFEARQVKAVKEIALKDRGEGWKLDQPLWVERMRCQCVMITGKIVNALRLITQAYAFVVRGPKQRSNEKIGPIIKTKALDLEHTIKIIPGSSYNPSPNFSDLKQVTFEIVICNFYAWLRDIEQTYLVNQLNWGITDMADTGTGDPDDKLLALPGGAIPSLYVPQEVEEV